MVLALKDMAIELGRTPTRNEFCPSIKGGRSRVDREFGNYTTLCLAAGLSPNDGANNKLTNKIFEVNIDTHLQNYIPREDIPRPPYESMAVISDIHWPFHKQTVIDRFIEYVGDVKPVWAIIDGDAWDMYSHGKFPRSHNIFTPEQEEQSAKEKNVEFWRKVQLASPVTKCVQMMGNHDVRPLKRTMEAQPQIEHWVKKYMEEHLFKFEGVRIIMDPREELMIGDIAVFHGYRSQLGAHRDYTLYNCINGHTHRPGVVFKRIRGQTLWEMNCGLAGDPEAKGLTYTPQKITEWVNSFGVVDKIGPRVVII